MFLETLVQLHNDVSKKKVEFFSLPYTYFKYIQKEEKKLLTQAHIVVIKQIPDLTAQKEVREVLRAVECIWTPGFA